MSVPTPHTFIRPDRKPPRKMREPVKPVEGGKFSLGYLASLIHQQFHRPNSIVSINSAATPREWGRTVDRSPASSLALNIPLTA